MTRTRRCSALQGRRKLWRTLAFEVEMLEIGVIRGAGRALAPMTDVGNNCRAVPEPRYQNSTVRDVTLRPIW